LNQSGKYLVLPESESVRLNKKQSINFVAL